MKKFIYSALIFCLVLCMHGCQRTSSEEKLIQCLNGGCSQRKQNTVIANYFEDLEKNSSRDYEIEGYDFDVHMNDEFGTGELIYIEMTYQLDTYDYNQTLTDLHKLYDKFLDAKADIFKFDSSMHIELRTRFIFTYQDELLDVVFLKIGSSGYEQLIVFIEQLENDFDEFLYEICDYLPMIFSYRDQMMVDLSLLTERAVMLLKTNPQRENLELSMGVVNSYVSQQKFKEIIQSLFKDALDDSVNIMLME
ncbi:hypothetical protein BK011_09030 [Tenericutes bacterium MZ-XQ]|nr:hypothetical protein BK011_09030 [Tenericutes bacterium MZ-XQ]